MIERTFKRLGAYMISNVLMSGIRTQLSNLYKNVVDIDFAMKDLERISGASGQQLSQAFEKSGDMAIRLGSSIKDVLGSVGEFSRLGLNMNDSLQMAESTALLASVGVMSLDKATEGLISTTRAYNITANDTLALVDKIVATDVSQAISSEGILDVLQRSSASLKAANSSLEENIALGVAMNTVLQNSEKTGTSLNTMAMRIRSTTGALREMGEETDSSFESITQLQQRVYELTNQKVDIFINEDTFDSIYNIIQGISKEWSNMSDKAQAELTQILGGTRQAQSVSSLITQFQTAEDAMVSMGQSSGKALELNNVIMDTASKKAEQLGASWEKLSQSAIDTTLIKGGLDGLRAIVDGLTAINNSTGGLLSAGAALGALVGVFRGLDAKGKIDGIKSFVKDIGKQAA